MSRQYAHHRHGNLAGLGATFPADYVFAGATVHYQATITGIGYIDQTLSDVRSNFQLLNYEYTPVSDTIVFNVRVTGDMNSINDVKSVLDGILYSNRFPVSQSMVRFLTNPRRDGSVQPPVNTPGVPPPITTLPPAAGNVDTSGGTGILGTAADFWLSDIAKSLNMSTNTLMIVGVAGIALLFLSSRR